jgi:hypothetical protein
MERGMRLNTVREDVVQLLNEKTTLTRVKETPLLAEFSRDLTEAAIRTSWTRWWGASTRSSASSRCSAGARRTTPC